MAIQPASSPDRQRQVTPVAYAPPGGYGLDIEVFTAAELRRRAGDVAARGFERVDFHSLLLITAGRYVHVVDFELLDCMRGALIVIQPGQVHHFGDLSACEGWMAVLRSEILPSRPGRAGELGQLEAMRRLETLPTRIMLPPASQAAVGEVFARMADDAAIPAGAALERAAINALLRTQLEALVIRLHIDSAALSDGAAVEPAQLQRFRRFRALVEQEFTRWHGVAPYAAHLGCSERSLARAAAVVANSSAKAILIDRIILEAKRLLAHSLLPVANIGYEIGFSEPTNFVKFFRRETRLTPGAFRDHMRHGDALPPARSGKR